MRKTLAVIMSLFCLLYLCNAYAEQYPATFSLRDGLKFGSTEEEIRAAMAGSTELTEGKLLGWASMGYDGDVGGKKATICFRLDSDKKLVEMGYQFECNSASETLSLYDYYRELLTKKYGEELSIPEGKSHILTGSALSGIASAGIKGKSEWLIQDGDNYIKIDLFAFSVNVYCVSVAHTDIAYTCFTQEDLNQAVDQKNDSQQAVLDDL